MLKLNLESKETINNGCGNTVTQFTVTVEKDTFYLIVDEDSYSIRRNEFMSVKKPSIVREGIIFELPSCDPVYDIVWEARNIHTTK